MSRNSNKTITIERSVISARSREQGSAKERINSAYTNNRQHTQGYEDVHYDEKDEFDINDLRPEHYFDCSSEGVDYIAQNQEIAYNINFNQSVVVNTQAKDVIRHDYIRDVEDLKKAIDDLDIAEKFNYKL